MSNRFRVEPSGFAPSVAMPSLSFQSLALYVGHGVSSQVFVTNRLLPASCPLVTTGHVGVGHPEKPLPPVRRADARSAQIGSPAGISQIFQVKANSGEPFAPIRARNLLSKDRCRSALGDETVKSGP